MLCQAAFAIDSPSIEAALREEIAARGIPGAFLVVVEKGKVVLAKGYGVTSMEDPRPVTERTLFRIGSTAKVFTAMAAVKLAEQGKLDLDAPIQVQGPFAAVTMHQLLTHTAGLADDAPQTGPPDEPALQRNAASYDATYRLAPPGKLFSYANTGYVLAGAAIERVTGKLFASSLAELVFQPLGMTRSTFRPLEAIMEPLALPHSPGGKLIRPFPDNAGAWPPGSLFTSAEDAAKFLLAGLPKELTARPVEIPAQKRRYGYGVTIEGSRIFHTGGRAGYGSRFEIFPEREAAFFVAGNLTGAVFSRTSEAIRKELGLLSADSPPAPKAISSEEARALAGRYRNRGPLAAEFVLTGDKLVLKLASRTMPVLSLGEDLYHIPGGAQLERFRILRDAAGQPEYLCAEVWCLARLRN